MEYEAKKTIAYRLEFDISNEYLEDIISCLIFNDKV